MENTEKNITEPEYNIWNKLTSGILVVFFLKPQFKCWSHELAIIHILSYMEAENDSVSLLSLMKASLAWVAG